MFVPAVAANKIARDMIFGTQCGATATNTATKTVENIDATNIQQNQQNSQKTLKTAEGSFQFSRSVPK